MQRKFQPRNIRIIEALSATGLRSIRYAKEIPNVKVVLANDLSPSACDAMRMNVRYNGVEEEEKPVPGVAPVTAAVGGVEGAPAVPVPDTEDLPNGRRPGCKGKVRVNEGDAW